MSQPDFKPSKPLFIFDPGWLFILAGLSVCAAGVLLPAQADLHALRTQLSALKETEERSCVRLNAHAQFLDQLERTEPDVVRRLAASQLNLIPAGETPVLLASSHPPPVTQWIDGTVPKVESSEVKPLPVTALSRLANGPDRLWLFAGGIMCVFIGLMLSPGLVRERSASADVDERVEPDSVVETPARVSIETKKRTAKDGDVGRADAAALISTATTPSTDDPLESLAPDDLARDDQPLTKDHVWSHRLVEIPPTQTIEAKILAIPAVPSSQPSNPASGETAISPPAATQAGIESPKTPKKSTTAGPATRPRQSQTQDVDSTRAPKDFGSSSSTPRKKSCLSIDNSARIDDDEIDPDPEVNSHSAESNEQDAHWPLGGASPESASRNRFEHYRNDLEDRTDHADGSGDSSSGHDTDID